MWHFATASAKARGRLYVHNTRQRRRSRVSAPFIANSWPQPVDAAKLKSLSKSSIALYGNAKAS